MKLRCVLLGAMLGGLGCAPLAVGQTSISLGFGGEPFVREVVRNPAKTRVLVVGQAGLGRQGFAVMLTPTGRILPEFGRSGRVRIDPRVSTSVTAAGLPDGRWIVGGTADGSPEGLGGGLLALNARGVTDTTFGQDGLVWLGELVVRVRSDAKGNILAAVQESPTTSSLVWATPAGSVIRRVALDGVALPTVLEPRGTGGWLVGGSHMVAGRGVTESIVYAVDDTGQIIRSFGTNGAITIPAAQATSPNNDDGSSTIPVSQISLTTSGMFTTTGTFHTPTGMPGLLQTRRFADGRMATRATGQPAQRLLRYPPIGVISACGNRKTFLWNTNQQAVLSTTGFIGGGQAVQMRQASTGGDFMARAVPRRDRCGVVVIGSNKNRVLVWLKAL